MVGTDWFMGVDPGKTGANVVLNSSGLVCIIESMPQDDELLRNFWSGVVEDAGVEYDKLWIVCEKVWSNPFWGKRHVFEFGRQKGRIEQAITSAGLSYYRITPTTWQNHFDMKKTARERKDSVGQRIWKKRLWALAQKQNPGVDITLAQADAVLIAEYCRNNKQEGTL